MSSEESKISYENKAKGELGALSKFWCIYEPNKPLVVGSKSYCVAYAKHHGISDKYIRRCLTMCGYNLPKYGVIYSDNCDDFDISNIVLFSRMEDAKQWCLENSYMVLISMNISMKKAGLDVLTHDKAVSTDVTEYKTPSGKKYDMIDYSCDELWFQAILPIHDMVLP